MFFSKNYGNNLTMFQIIGRKGDRDTKKAMMFFKERREEYQLIDLDVKDLAKREWESILSSVDSPESLIDKTNKFYKKEGYEYRDYDPLEELIMHPELLIIPIIRTKKDVIVGFDLNKLKELYKCAM